MGTNENIVAGGTPEPIIQPPLGPNIQEQPQKQLAPSPVSSPVPAPVSDPLATAAAVQGKEADADAIIVKMPPTEAPVKPLSIDQSKDNGSTSRETPVEPLSIDQSKDNGSTRRKIPFKNIFQKRKKSSEKIRDKKQRQNLQLRKSMLPKDALMALNEVKGVTISDFTIDSNPYGGFTAVVTVNSMKYEGKGVSSMSAKNAACEKAWRDLIIAKMTPKVKLPPVNSSEDNSVEPMDTNDDEEDDLPILNLASFAIYKLFSEWERDGYAVPKMLPSAANASVPGDADASPAPKKKKAGRAELPTGWENQHPASLLSIMRPGITYVDHGTSGDQPNAIQNLGTVVDDQEFTASGRSKKIARRNVAVSVCNTLFGTNFSIENPTAAPPGANPDDDDD